MSRYEDLCRSWEVAWTNYYDHRDRVVEFYRNRFLPGLVAYLKCPPENVWWFDFQKPGWENLGLSKSMKVDDDCFWTTGIAIKMGRTDMGYLIRCMGIDGRFTVRVAGATFKIENDADLEACYRHIFQHIRDGNLNGFNEALRDGSDRRIGFM